MNQLDIHKYMEYIVTELKDHSKHERTNRKMIDLFKDLPDYLRFNKLMATKQLLNGFKVIISSSIVFS